MSTQMNSLLDEIRRVTAEQYGTAKTASGPDQGKTTFPQDEVDDGETAAEHGSRSRENEADVKSGVPGVSADEAPDASASESQAAVQPQIGITQSETGGDPSIEDDYESTQHDPGTESVATADDGEKYAAWSVEKLAAAAARLGAALRTAPATAAKPRATPKQAAAAGYADAAAAGIDPALFLANTVKEAQHAADLTLAYLPYYLKQAEGDLPLDEAPPEEALPGELPPGGDAPPPGDDPAAALDDVLAGAPPEAPPSNAPPSLDETVDGFNGAADDMQITPEILQQLLALLQAKGAPAAEKAARFNKLASAAVDRRMAGRHAIGAPKTARERAIREKARAYLSEIVKAAN